MGKPIKNVMLLGGGRIAFYLSQQLTKLGIRPRIVEINEARAQYLAEQLPDASIICADCTSSEILEDEGITEMDACVALTGNDEENVILSIFAHTSGVDRIITKVDRLSFIKMLPQLGVDCTVSPRQISSSTVLRYLRGLENSKKLAQKLAQKGEKSESLPSIGIKSLYKLCDDRAEALEFDVSRDFSLLGIPFASEKFKLKPNTLIASIVRRGKVIYPHGASTLEVGDSVIVVTTNLQLSELNDIVD
jgi:trk system potassium uptake protein TrkA